MSPVELAPSYNGVRCEMKARIEILTSYATAFRELVNDCVWSRKEESYRALRLNSETDWSFVCVAMDIVDDSSLAIENFLRFGLDGPSRWDDVGERYLRLYGALSAAYVQQQAIWKLYALMNCPNPARVRKRLRGLKIATLRHQLASHSLDFLEGDARADCAIVPVRVGLSGFTCTVTENRGDASRTIRLDEALEEHFEPVTEVLDQTYEKSIETLCKGQRRKIEGLQKRLDDLRFEKAGDLILRASDGHKQCEIRVIFLERDETQKHDGCCDGSADPQPWHNVCAARRIGRLIAAEGILEGDGDSKRPWSRCR